MSTFPAKLTTRLLPPLQFMRKLLENLGYIQSSVSLPPYLLKFSFIENRHLGSNHGADAIHQQCHTDLHYQASATTPIIVDITREHAKTKIHPIKHKLSPTPPKIHPNQTLPFQKQSQHRCHLPTTPNDPLPPGYCHHSNSWGYCSRTREGTSNQVRALPHTTQNSS